MIFLFMGRSVEAREAIEGALEVFNASAETDQMAARAAGQDAGVAILALTSWVLWILGHVDTAVSRMAAALERADRSTMRTHRLMLGTMRRFYTRYAASL